MTFIQVGTQFFLVSVSLQICGFGHLTKRFSLTNNILFLGIPNNSKFEGNCLWNLWELLGIAKTPMRICGNS